MTAPDLDSDGLDARRRRIHFRAWRRGMREMDLLLGGFADANLALLPEGDLAQLEALLDVPDQQLYGWIVGTAPIPPERRSPLLGRMIAFHHRPAADPR